MIAQMIPVNLVHEIKDIGFDYGMSPKEIADRILEGAETLWERTVTVDLGLGKVVEISDQQVSSGG